jgi:galactoside O-acetyltransferase
MSFLTHTELIKIGFNRIGKNVLISDAASVYNPKKISIGDNFRLDDFCILSAGNGGIVIGNYVHIACHSCVIGGDQVEILDYSNISSRVSIYSKSDDFSGDYMTNPCVPEHFTNVISKPVKIHKHVIIGSGSVILPGVTLHEGVAIGALSLVTTTCQANNIYAGSPLKLIKPRKQGFKEYEQKLLNSL